MAVWVSKRDLLMLGVSEPTIYRNSEPRGKWVAQRSKREGQIGQPQKEYLLESLPADLQIKWAKLDAERRSSAVEPIEPISQSQDDRLDALQSALARFSPPAYTLEQRQAIEQRCIELGRLCDEAIKLIASLKRSSGISVASPGATEAGPGRKYHPQIAKLAARTASADQVYLAMYPSAVKPISVPTFLRLIKQYRKRGLVAFIRQTQTLSPQKDDRFLAIPQEAEDWLRANLSSYDKASITEFGSAWLKAARRYGWTLPFTSYQPGREQSCYAWLRRWKRKVPASTLTLIRKGERGFEATYSYILRDYEDLNPRDGWTMDWRQFDVAFWLPAGRKGDKPVLTRQWLCPVYDLVTDAVFGFHIDSRPSARGVTLAYLNAIGDADWKNEPGLELLRGVQRQHGEIKPFLHLDNGKDFRAHSIEGKEITVARFDVKTGLAATLNTYNVDLSAEVAIRVRHAKPFNAKSKIIERFFKYVTEWEKALPGYCGNRPESKPYYFAAACRIHQTFVKGVAPKSSDIKQLPKLWLEAYEANKKKYGFGTPFLSEAEFKAAFMKWLLEYLRTPKQSLKDERGWRTPIDVLQQSADSPHKLTDKTMAALLMTPRVVTIQRGEVAVRWGGESFVYREVKSELSDGGAIYRLPAKTQVEFRYNPNQIGRALILTGSTTLCWVEQPELMGWNASQADFEEANARKKFSRKVAEEFFNTQTQPKDWRDVAEERMPEALPLAVNAGAVYEGDEATEPAAPHNRAAPIRMMTRFDRKSADAPREVAKEASHLQVVSQQLDEDDFNSLKSYEGSGGADEIKAAWED